MVECRPIVSDARYEEFSKMRRAARDNIFSALAVPAHLVDVRVDPWVGLIAFLQEAAAQRERDMQNWSV